MELPNTNSLMGFTLSHLYGMRIPTILLKFDTIVDLDLYE